MKAVCVLACAALAFVTVHGQGEYCAILPLLPPSLLLVTLPFTRPIWQLRLHSLLLPLTRSFLSPVFVVVVVVLFCFVLFCVCTCCVLFSVSWYESVTIDEHQETTVKEHC